MSKDLIGDVFGPNGLISRFHENYEHREGQIEMARRISDAFTKKKHLVVEAPTGTGKTLAYLVPAIAASLKLNKRIIISTGTKNLQEQLMEKDIPFLQKVLPVKFSASYMKGRGNYACLFRVMKAESQPILDGMDQLNHFKKISKWIGDTKTGDRSELTDLPENLSFWHRINARGEICIGQKCPDFEPCFITRMRDQADNADIVVVNHHLFFADLNVRENRFGKVLPDYGAVIFDEAHLIEDIASDYFGTRVSNFQIEELVRDADTLSFDDGVSSRELTKSSAKVLGLSEQFWMRFSQAKYDGRYALDRELFVYKNSEKNEPTPLGEAFLALDNALKEFDVILSGNKNESPETESLLQRVQQVRFDLNFVSNQPDRNFVYWLERRGKGVYMNASPIDVSELLNERLFEKTDTCVLTSATLSSKGSFTFFRDRIGLFSKTTEVYAAPSAFDYENQAALYLPKAMPDPRSPEFTQLAAGEIVKILKATGGRTFVLCTSNYSMNALYELVSSRVNFPCLLQGSMSKAGLIEQFRTTPGAVLFATASFWQGVDVRGDQLSCVIIDKLPFAVPSDPVVAARSRHIEENGGKPFFEYSVPQAVITLKQGIGRLIRSKTDRGLIAILDPRLTTKGYGRDFLESLPRMRIIRDLEKAESLFAQDQEDR